MTCKRIGILWEVTYKGKPYAGFRVIDALALAMAAKLRGGK